MLRIKALPALSVALILSVAPALAGHSVAVQFFGEASILGDLNDAAAIAGVGAEDLLASAADPDDPAAEDFVCFLMELRDPETSRTIGEAIDCVFFKINSPLGMDFEPSEPIAVRAFSFFLLPAGSLVSTGLTTLAPAVPGVGDGRGFTHATISIPEEDNIVESTGVFTLVDFRQARVSGAVGLGQAVSFDCLWVLSTQGN